MSEKKTREQEAKSLSEIEAYLKYRSDFHSAQSGHRISFDSHKKKDKIAQTKTTFKTMFQPKHDETVAETPKFYKTLSIASLFLEGIVSIAFIFIMFLVSNILWIPQLSETVQPFAQIASFVFSMIVVWKA